VPLSLIAVARINKEHCLMYSFHLWMKGMTPIKISLMSPVHNFGGQITEISQAGDNIYNVTSEFSLLIWQLWTNLKIINILA